jgi:hypothetical protein
MGTACSNIEELDNQELSMCSEMKMIISNEERINNECKYKVFWGLFYRLYLFTYF